MRIVWVLFASCTAPPSSDSESDSGAPPDAGGSGADPTVPTDPSKNPLDPLPVGVWSYFELPGMTCGNGTPVGIGVNPGTDPDLVAVYLQGGGACWDWWTCIALPDTATNVNDTYGQALFDSEIALVDASGLTDRTRDVRLAGATWMYVPYCTGDLHAGDRTTAYDPFQPGLPTHHAGDRNLRIALDWLSSRTAEATTIRVIGVSAGGFGAQLQAVAFAEAWPGADLAILADGAPLVEPAPGVWGTWSAAWAMDCPGCAATPTEVIPAALAVAPDLRFGLITWSEDPTIGLFFGVLGAMAPKVEALSAEIYADPNHSMFRLVGLDHGMLDTPDDLVAPDGTVLRDWVDAWVDGPVADVR